MKTIHEAVAEKITSAAPLVKDTIVNKLADIEITRRVNIISTALDVLASLQKELKKIDREDVITYENGTEKKVMSKDRYESVGKIKGKIGELEAAATKALTDNTDEAYKKVVELNEKFKNDGGDKK